jgi:uncharacterized protein YbjT (DUF2867 family)
MKIIVLGGTGFIGQHVCEKLAAAGHEITVPTRRLGNAKHIISLPRLTLLACDVHNPAQLEQAVAGHEVVVNLVAVLHGNEARFEQVHVQLPRTIVAACQTGGVQRIVHVSALGAALDAPSMYLRSKARGEAVLQEAALLQHGLSLAIVRPSVVFGAQDKLLNVFAKLQKLAPLVPLAGADTQFQPVWVQDVAQALVLLATQAHTLHYANHTWSRGVSIDDTPQTLSQVTLHELCGNDVLSLRDLFALAGRCVGAHRAVVPLPMPLARLQAWVMEHLPGEPLMSRDNLDSMRSPNVATPGQPGLDVLGISPSSIYAIAPTYLGTPRTLDQYRKDASCR